VVGCGFASDTCWALVAYVCRCASVMVCQQCATSQMLNPASAPAQASDADADADGGAGAAKGKAYSMEHYLKLLEAPINSGSTGEALDFGEQSDEAAAAAAAATTAPPASNPAGDDQKSAGKKGGKKAKEPGKGKGKGKDKGDGQDKTKETKDAPSGKQWPAPEGQTWTMSNLQRAWVTQRTQPGSSSSSSSGNSSGPDQPAGAAVPTAHSPHVLLLRPLPAATDTITSELQRATRSVQQVLSGQGQGQGQDTSFVDLEFPPTSRFILGQDLHPVVTQAPHQRYHLPAGWRRLSQIRLDGQLSVLPLVHQPHPEGRARTFQVRGQNLAPFPLRLALQPVDAQPFPSTLFARRRSEWLPGTSPG
jgi:hypothetical protein